MPFSNLDSFLKCSTPSVSSHFLPEKSLPNSRESHFYVLEDLWDCYEEWSAYGLGVPIRLSDREPIIQYFTPYFSALQIYTSRSLNSRDGVEEMFLESETESTSSENEDNRLSRTDSNSSNQIWDSDDSGTDHDVDLKIGRDHGKLYCQYFENSNPYHRLPFRDMIRKLAEEYPGMNSLRSIDLSPASWMAIAWYPIYHLPAQRNPKDLSTAFLTFHSLSSSNYDGGSPRNREERRTASLPPFGLATYRMQRKIWIGRDTEDSEKVNSLVTAAASWLTQVEANHPDFTFFSRSM